MTIAGGLGAALAAGSLLGAGSAAAAGTRPQPPARTAAHYSVAGRSALGESWQPSAPQTAAEHAGGMVPGEVLLSWNGAVPSAGLAAHGVKALRQLATGYGVASVSAKDTTAAAAALATVPGVTTAVPDRYVTSMISSSTPVPASTLAAASTQAAKVQHDTATLATANSGLPDNYGITSSLESWLNSGGVNALGAYSELETRYGRLPGQGEIITNVSVGDLTDQSMADAGDAYVKQNGPTTVVSGGQRYLDLPSMPLIPTYVADAQGDLNALGSTEDQDPTDGEILLDFSVMAPLPHDRQRPSNTGSGYTDLLGIAPGAQYRLVVPSSPTTDQIASAMLAAARQTPRPNVINASLGFGTDTTGFAGRYLEDDPLMQSTISTIVRRYGITVSIAANDGTRLYTPASVGPDGGSTPTDLAYSPNQATNINDDAMSTAPSRVLDSGAIASGGTTTDDTLAGGSSGPATVAETRISGSGDFSSGFGSRIDLSAPSDNIPAFYHQTGGTPQGVGVALTGGTSAAAPEIAAAAAVVDAAGKLAGRTLTPGQIRSLLENTGRAVRTPGQIDQTLDVGPQVDLTAAVQSLLPRTPHSGAQIVRLGIAHQQPQGNYGASFLEATDPTDIDLAGPADGRFGQTGEDLLTPITFAADVVGAGHGSSYRLTVGSGSTSQTFESSVPSVRLTPIQLLTAAGLPVVSTGSRTVQVTFQVLTRGAPTASVTQQITLGPSDGTHTEAQAPTAPASVKADQSVTVHYDLSGVRDVASPELALSTPGHWNSLLAPIFNVAWSTPLTATSGTVTVPASAFKGGGIYGLTVIQDSSNANVPVYGAFTPIRVDGGTPAQRPAAPTLAAGGKHYVNGQADAAWAASGHQAEIKRSAPEFSVRYSVDSVWGATGAVMEISAGAPTLFNSLNTFTEQNGTGRDSDGFDSGSVVYQPLSGTSGTAQFDAIKLGLGTSSQYNVRVLPTGRNGQVIGQASPSSALVVDDGLPPNGATVVDFAAKGADSVAILTDSPQGESVRHYDTSTGEYGSVITSDDSQSAPYAILGVDDVAHSVALLHVVDEDSYQIEIRNLSDGSLVGTPVVVASPPSLVVGARVDAARHEAWVLQWAAPDYRDELLPVGMTTGALGTPVEPDATAKAGPDYYNSIDLDASTGTVQLARLTDSPICFLNSLNAVINVSEATGAVTVPGTSEPGCGTNFASAQDGGKAWLLNYRSFSVNLLGTTSLDWIDEKTLGSGTTSALRQQMAGALAVDSAHDLALVAYMSPQPKSVFGHPGGLLTDSNSRSQIDVIDTDTGAVVKTLSEFDFAGEFSSPLFQTAEPNIQLDTATRTGYTFAPGSGQIEAFTY